MENETVIEQTPIVETPTQQAPQFTKTSFGSGTIDAVEAPITQDAPIVTEAAAIVVAPTENIEVDETVSAFVMTNFDAPTVQTEEEKAQVQVVSNWKDELKKADKREVLKEIGYDEFIADFAEFRANGGDAYEYLQAKSFDWNKVDDYSIIENDFKKEYPNLDNAQIERLISKKYNLNSIDDEDKEDGLIMMKADSHKSRLGKIDNQSKFEIPAVAKPQEAINQQAQIEEQQRFEQEQQLQFEKTNKFINEHEATKNLMASKRVTIPLAEGVNFNFNADPEVLQSVAFGKNWLRAIAENPQEVDDSKLVPDVAKLQRIAIMALNPNYEKDLFNFGKAQGKKEFISGGQNAQRPVGVTPTVSTDSPTQSWGRAELKTFGSN